MGDELATRTPVGQEGKIGKISPEDVVLPGEDGAYLVRVCSAYVSCSQKPNTGVSREWWRSKKCRGETEKPSKSWERASGLGRGKETSRAS